MQVHNAAIDDLGSLVVEMRDLANLRDRGFDVAAELASKELEISTMIGSNIASLPNETAFMSSTADPTSLLNIEDVNYFSNLSVNDAFVMNAWGKENNVGDKIIMMGDPFLNFTKAIGAEVDKSARGLGIRSNRYTMLVDDMKVIKLQEEKDTGSCEISAAENFIKLI